MALVASVATGDHGTANALARRELAQLCAELLQVLAAFPEARAVVAEALADTPASDGKPPVV